MLDNKNIDFEYCAFSCPKGKKKTKEFLDKNNSAYDAALDMHWFVEECIKTCERCKSGKSKT